MNTNTFDRKNLNFASNNANQVSRGTSGKTTSSQTPWYRDSLTDPHTSRHTCRENSGRRPWYGRLNPKKYSQLQHSEIVDRNLSDSAFRLLQVMRALSRDGEVVVEIRYLAINLNKSEEWVKKWKRDLIAKGYLAQNKRYDRSGNHRQMANLYRLFYPIQAYPPPVYDHTPQVLRETPKAKPSPLPPKPEPASPPVTDAAAQVLAGELAQELGVAKDEILTACREELAQKTVEEAKIQLRSDWERWVKIAILFAAITPEKFWRIDRHFLARLESDALRKQELQRHREQHETRVRTRCHWKERRSLEAQRLANLARVGTHDPGGSSGSSDEERKEREDYAMWAGFSEAFRKANPWKGKLYETL